MVRKSELSPPTSQPSSLQITARILYPIQQWLFMSLDCNAANTCCLRERSEFTLISELLGQKQEDNSNFLIKMIRN